MNATCSLVVLVSLAAASLATPSAAAVCVDVAGSYCTLGAETRAECANGTGTGVFVAALGTWREAACLRTMMACLDLAGVPCALGLDPTCNPDTTLAPVVVLGMGGCGEPDVWPRLCAPDPLGEFGSLACAAFACRSGSGIGVEAADGEVVCVRLVD